MDAPKRFDSDPDEQEVGFAGNLQLQLVLLHGLFDRQNLVIKENNNIVTNQLNLKVYDFRNFAKMI